VARPRGSGRCLACCNGEGTAHAANARAIHRKEGRANEEGPRILERLTVAPTVSHMVSQSDSFETALVRDEPVREAREAEAQALAAADSAQSPV